MRQSRKRNRTAPIIGAQWKPVQLFQCVGPCDLVFFRLQDWNI